MFGRWNGSLGFQRVLRITLVQTCETSKRIHFKAHPSIHKVLFDASSATLADDEL